MNELAQEIHEIARSKGFYERRHRLGEFLMLIVSELSEALEADRTKNWARLNEYADEKTREGFEKHVKDSFEDEIADAIIRILDMCAALNIDIDWHVREKIEYNRHRERLHGKIY